MAKTRPLILLASQEYAPASIADTFEIVKEPMPSSLVVKQRGSRHTWPQFRRQLMNGFGKPSALHSSRSVAPNVMVTFRCGLITIVGATLEKNKK